MVIKLNEAILSLGSNLGNRKENLNLAIEKINTTENTKVNAVSNFYETKPFGVPDKQNKYINCCIKVLTSLNAEKLLEKCLKIEASMGRTRPYKFAPRIIDIDLILYENETINTEKLTIPHPRMLERAFVLVPMSEICKDMKFKSWDFKSFFDNYKYNKEKFIQKIY